jgi:hypothetical protein
MSGLPDSPNPASIVPGSLGGSAVPVRPRWGRSLTLAAANEDTSARV